MSEGKFMTSWGKPRWIIGKRFYGNKFDVLPIEWLGKIYRKINHAILDCNPCNLQGWVLLISWPGYCRIGQASYEKPSEK